jgi:hypothetical protein
VIIWYERTSHHGRHTSLLLLRDTSATIIRVISTEAVATKDHSNNLIISLTSLTQSETDSHKYLLTISQIEAVTTYNLEILDYLWMFFIFFRAYSVNISILCVPNLGEATLSSFVVGPLVSDPK